ncbi:MAG: glycosyltransferase family 4 protein, partial [Proteobacteria bacterium]|nr:glycosyltransferase family 4 protein [Pseudomonadota bacterium]
LFKPIAREDAKNSLKLSRDKRYLLSVGMLENRKGTDVLLHALPPVFSACPDVDLLLIGTAVRKEYEAMLREITRQSGISERIHFLGQIRNDDLPLYYNASDLFILPSIKAEGVPKVLMEAAACNLPYLTSPIGGIPAFLREVGGGTLIEPGSPENICRALIDFFSHPPEKQDVREKARKHSWDAILRSTVEVFEHLEKKYYPKTSS